MLLPKLGHLGSVCCVAICFLLSACVQAENVSQKKSAEATSIAERVPTLGSSSRFGIDYIFPLDSRYQRLGFAEHLAGTGAGWANFALVGWNKIEPQRPRNGRHFYRWKKLDQAMSHWQDAGFHIVVTLRMGRGWFSGPHKFRPEGLPVIINTMMNNADRLPQPEYMDDFEQWVTAVVERYDGDGHADMPGLLRPVLHYQIGNEVGNPAFWTGTVDDYFVLLERGARAARLANSRVKIIPAGLRPNDFFLENQSGGDPIPPLKKYLDRLSPAFRAGIMRSLELDERIVGAAGMYDIVDAAGNGSWYRSTPGFFRWLKRKMKAASNNAQIWDLESRTEPILKAVETTHAYLHLEVPDGEGVLKAMRQRLNPQHREATEWYRAEQACLLAKVYVTRFAAGAEKVFVGMPMDWDKGLEAIAWPNPYMGLISSSGKPWPAMHTLAFLVRELDGFTSAERLSASEGVSLYRFKFADQRKSIWVAWLAEARPRGWADANPERTITFKQIPSFSEAHEIPTTGNEPTLVKPVEPGLPLSLTISATPVVIKGAL